MTSKNTHSWLSQILSPVSPDTFFNTYFGKKPLLIRGSAGKFDRLMKPQNFIYGLDRVVEIRCVFDGLKQASIQPADIREMYDAGATICVTGIDLAHASLRQAARHVEKEAGFAGLVDFRAYLSPPGAGFDYHYDARVATSLQLSGTKTWWYSDLPHVAFPTENSGRSDMQAIKQAVSQHRIRRVILEPGDLLCLPAGVWHKAQAGSGGSLALNMAFNHRGATVADVLMAALREQLSTLPSAAMPFMTGYRGQHEPEMAQQLAHCVDEAQHILEQLRHKQAVRRLSKLTQSLKTSRTQR